MSDEQESKEQQGGDESADKGQERDPKEEVKALEEDPPEELSDWPSGRAMYETYGGPEGEHSYEEGPERKLGPSSLRRHEDGSVTVGGEKVDNPDEHKARPISGGPSDPEASPSETERAETESGGSSEGGSEEDGDSEGEG